MKQPYPIRLFVAAALLAISPVIGGCQKGPSYRTTTLSGRVTIDGEPVPEGAILFNPLPGSAGAVVGCEIKAGAYRCEQVPFGKFNVMIVAHAAELITIIEKGTGTPRQVPKDILPPAYANGIPCEIGSGTTEQNFDLKSSKSPNSPSMPPSTTGDVRR